MKTLSELRATPRLVIKFSSEDGGIAEAYCFSSKKPYPATVIFSWGGGWDHVSVSFTNRCPTWEEMCEAKRMFFHPGETAWEYHPMESEYVNNHPYCLHIWRCQHSSIPIPPAWMLGKKKGQTFSEAMQQGKQALAAMEDTHAQ